MLNIKQIFHRIMQSMVAFFFSKDAIVFCLFLLFAFCVWFTHEWGKQQASPEVVEQAGPKYTEKVFHKEIRTRGVPQNEELVLFPSDVAISAKIETKYYESVTADDFLVVCTYPKNDEERLVVEVSCSDPSVLSFKVTPMEVEYLIRVL